MWPNVLMVVQQKDLGQMPNNFGYFDELTLLSQKNPFAIFATAKVKNTQMRADAPLRDPLKYQFNKRPLCEFHEEKDMRPT